MTVKQFKQKVIGRTITDINVTKSVGTSWDSDYRGLEVGTITLDNGVKIELDTYYPEICVELVEPK